MPRGFGRALPLATQTDMLRRLLGFAALLQAAPLPTFAAAPDHTDSSPSIIETAFRLGVPRNYADVRKLDRVAEPARLVLIGGIDALGFEQRLTPSAARAWSRMREAAARDGVELRSVSTFRSVEVQLAILRGKLARGQTIDRILHVSAAPGFSEHHSGRAIDITTPGYAPLEEEFERSPAFAWLSTNAQRYRFILSYPRGNPHGFAYEPWHWCWQDDDLQPAPFESEFMTEAGSPASDRYARQ
jgi:D-alanyl-D-alanine carboxypeptidase